MSSHAILDKLKVANLRRSLLQYVAVAIVGAVVWAVLGITYGDRLFVCVFSFEEQAMPQVLADTAWAILVMPAIFFGTHADEPLGMVGMAIVYALNGIAWGLAATFAFKKIPVLWRRLRIQLRWSRRQRSNGPISV